ncbi:MAG: hypothetical protein ACI4RP_07930 [Acutalibacteraceae bacterium]
MEQEQFAALMPYIIASLVEMIVNKQGIGERQAITKLYSSKLYSLIEKEESKVWQYSTPMLYALLEQEENIGTIYFPDV